MELLPFFKAVMDEDRSPVVICDLKHVIVYMNPTACQRYKADLTGKSLLDCHNEESCRRIELVLEMFRESRDNNRVYTFRNDKENKDVYMIALRDDKGELIGYYEKHEYRNAEQGSLYHTV